ncbi:MAG: OmpA family protein [Cyanobacteria bacterium J06649_4]
MANEPDLKGDNTDSSAANNRSDFFSPRPNLGRGFDAYQPQPPSPSPYPQSHPQSHPQGSPHGQSPSASPNVSRTQQPFPPVPSATPETPRRRRWFGWLSKSSASPENSLHGESALPTQAFNTPPQLPPSTQLTTAYPQTQIRSRAEQTTAEQPMPEGAFFDENGEYVALPVPVAPRFWEKQPYSAIAHLLALGGTLTLAWLFGILAAQILPGRLEKPPLQESALRKTSRLASRLWHLPQLWHSPTQETRITAIPIPETSPIAETIELSPIERQPLLDELNAIDTEVLTLERRLQSLEKKLGKPPYQGADLNSRVSALRTALDPPVRNTLEPSYEPVATDPNDRLLDVAKLKITLPSDALFTPGQSDIKDAPLLRQVLDQLVNYPEATVLIRSYSDDQLGAIASRSYTLDQANTLASYLQTALPTTYRWVTLGGGLSQPITDNSDAAARQQNRRIEILVDTR